MAKIDIKKRAERNNKIRRTIAKIEQTVKKLEVMKEEYLRSAVAAKARGESASYAIAKNGLNITLTQIKRAREMLLNIEITSELQKMGETNADFLTGMSTIAKSISKINKKSDFVKLQKEIERALSGMEEAQAGLDGFLQNTDAAFAALTAAPGALTDSQIDRLIDGQVSEKELLMDEQIDKLLGGTGFATEKAPEIERDMRVSVGGPTETPTADGTAAIAKPFPAPNGCFDFSAKPSSALSLDAFRNVDTEKTVSVSLADVIAPQDGVSVYLGRTSDGDIEKLDFSATPHVLVTGMIGSGKSTFLRQALCSLMLTKGADAVRFVLFDFKNEGFNAFDGTAHLSANTITDTPEVLPTFAALTAELNKRYELFSGAGVRNIEAYNKTALKKLPYIIVMFDEYGDAMDADAKAFENAFIALSRQSAGAGIFTVLCTRNIAPSVVTAAIRANTDAHIAFKLHSGEESTLVLGELGGETPGGAGELLCERNGKITRCNAPHVSEREVAAVISALKGDVA